VESVEGICKSYQAFEDQNPKHHLDANLVSSL